MNYIYLKDPISRFFFHLSMLFIDGNILLTSVCLLILITAVF